MCGIKQVAGAHKGEKNNSKQLIADSKRINIARDDDIQRIKNTKYIEHQKHKAQNTEHTEKQMFLWNWVFTLKSKMYWVSAVLNFFPIFSIQDRLFSLGIH